MIQKFMHVWKRLANKYSFSEIGIEEGRRRLLVLLFSLIGLMILAIFSVIDFVQGNLVESIVELFASLCMFFCLVRLRSPGPIEWVYHCITATTAAVFLFLAVDGGVQGEKIYYSFLFQVFTFFLLGTGKGMLWNLAFFVCLIMIFHNPGGFIDAYLYPQEGAVRFGVVFILIAMLDYTYETVLSTPKEALNVKKKN